MGFLYDFFGSGNMDVSAGRLMLMAFLLVVVVDGAVVTTDDMLFEDVYRCNQFARAIERGELGPNKQSYIWQENISAYCIPKMVSKDTDLFK